MDLSRFVVIHCRAHGRPESWLPNERNRPPARPGKPVLHPARWPRFHPASSVTKVMGDGAVV